MSRKNGAVHACDARSKGKVCMENSTPFPLANYLMEGSYMIKYVKLKWYNFNGLKWYKGLDLIPLIQLGVEHEQNSKPVPGLRSSVPAAPG